MKPRNFPARKKARQVAAEFIKNNWPNISCRSKAIKDMPEVQAARSIRTKKNRG